MATPWMWPGSGTGGTLPAGVREVGAGLASVYSANPCAGAGGATGTSNSAVPAAKIAPPFRNGVLLNDGKLEP